MSIPGLLDHTATVRRLSETLNEYREKVNTYTAQSNPVRIALVPPRETRSDLGAGDMERGLLEGYARANANIQKEDILEVTKGPEAPVNLRVLTLAHPRGHHVEFTCERFTGAL